MSPEGVVARQFQGFLPACIKVGLAPIPDVDQASPLQTFELRLELPKPAVATKLG